MVNDSHAMSTSKRTRGQQLIWQADVACESLSTCSFELVKINGASLLQKWLKLGAKNTIIKVKGSKMQFNF
jgi:hypothetical protein